MQDKLAGEIRSDCAYTIREFCRRTGIGRERVTERFTVRRMANKRFVLGRDFIEALAAEKPDAPLLNRPHTPNCVVNGVRQQFAESP